MRRMFLACLLVLVLISSWTVVCAADFYVIPVKKCCTCKGALNGTRWCDNGDGTVTDLTTCLVWLKYADWGGQLPWRSYISANYNDAHTQAGLLSHGTIIHQGVYDVRLFDGSTVGDWRLPTETELEGITHGPEAVFSGTMRAFRGVQANYYWSSTTTAGAISKARNIAMNSGGWDSFNKTVTCYVWPVRGGQ